MLRDKDPDNLKGNGLLTTEKRNDTQKKKAVI